MRPIVALLTDFGGQDHYVGAVKGAVLAACREAAVVDLTHELPPHDVMAAAFSLGAARAAFPAGTTFLAVVDPGVGSARRALALEAHGQSFVGPDNGIFTFVLAEQPSARVHEITNQGLFRAHVSATFHARDIFGPVAGRLAAGMDLAEVGPPLADPVRLSLARPRAVREAEWEGEVLHVDRFGNLITNFTTEALAAALVSVNGDPTDLVVAVEGMVLPLVRTYSDVAEGEACALAGSSGRLEVSVNRGSAARQLGAARGAPVRVRRVSTTGV
jgi:S-adenosyl-L-methionine hydrolase (adenosine-forming)